MRVAKKASISIDPKLRKFSNFRTEHRSFVTLAFGHAGKPKILSYDLDSLVISGALHTALKTAGTVFSMDSSLAKSQLWYTFLFLVTLIVTYVWFPHDSTRSPSDALEELARYLNVFIPVVLGLYISLCLARWWSLRIDGIGAVLDASANIALLMSGMFPDPEFEGLHDQVLKWGVASLSTIVSSCRGKKEIDGLGPKGDGLLSDEEMEIMESVPYRARPVLLWCWILMLNSKICEEHNLPPGKYRDIAQECVLARNGISLIWTYLRTQLPFAYVHLVAILVNLNNLVTSVKCGMSMALGIKTEVYSECVNQILFLFVVPPLYQGLLGISHVIHDPFGEDMLDFPVMAFQEYMNEGCLITTGSGLRCPALRESWNPSPPQPDCGLVDSKLQASNEKFLEPVTDGIELREGKVDTCAELKLTVKRVDEAVKQSAEGGQELIASLQQEVQGLESTAAEMNRKIQSLESQMRGSSGMQQISTGGWCQAPEVAAPRTLPRVNEQGAVGINR
jgi:hypothetical protein